MIEIAKREDFIIIFSDADVRKNPRDKNGAVAFNLHFNSLSDGSEIAFKSNSIFDTIMRFIRSEKNKLIFLHNINFDSSFPPIDKNVFTGNGYLQNQINDSLLQENILPTNLIQYDILDQKAEVALHIRATDALSNSEMKVEDCFYENALKTLGIAKTAKVDVYSDDLNYAKKLCARLGEYNFNFVEENYSLSAIELLSSLSGYDSIISSKSTLSWWSCNFATMKNRNVKIISPWKAPLHQTLWTK